MFIMRGFGTIHFILFVVAAVMIWRSPGTDRRRKLNQTFLAAFVPVLGSLICIFVHGSDRAPTTFPPEHDFKDNRHIRDVTPD